MALSPSTIRNDLKCGKGAISKGEKCSKGAPTALNATQKTLLTAGAIGLGVGLLKATTGRRRPAAGRITIVDPPSASSTSASPRPSGPPRLPGSPAPYGLLPPARVPQSKTQRMRANTAAAVRQAEGRLAQTAQEEVRRIAQIGNTMAATGEATGMAVKTGLRELRLRTEAARRRFEPGYRAPAPKRLPGGVQAPFAPADLTPERVALPIDPRTGQPRRQRARGFAPRSDNYISHYASSYIDPARPRTDACWKGYVQAGMKRKGNREVPNCVPASGNTVKAKTQEDTESDGKKYTKVVTNPETGRKNRVRYGAKGYTIAPGTDKGDNYCARSFGDMKSHGKDCSGPDRNTPLCLSRAKWKCSGKTSRRS